MLTLILSLALAGHTSTLDYSQRLPWYTVAGRLDDGTLVVKPSNEFRVFPPGEKWFKHTYPPQYSACYRHTDGEYWLQVYHDAGEYKGKPLDRHETPARGTTLTRPHWWNEMPGHAGMMGFAVSWVRYQVEIAGHVIEFGVKLYYNGVVELERLSA